MMNDNVLIGSLRPKGSQAVCIKTTSLSWDHKVAYSWPLIVKVTKLLKFCKTGCPIYRLHYLFRKKWHTRYTKRINGGLSLMICACEKIFTKHFLTAAILQYGFQLYFNNCITYFVRCCSIEHVVLRIFHNKPDS